MKVLRLIISLVAVALFTGASQFNGVNTTQSDSVLGVTGSTSIMGMTLDAGGGGGGALISENFEGTGAPAGFGSIGTVNYDSTAIVLEGAQSWSATAGSTPNLSYAAFTAQSSVDVYFRFQASTVSGGRQVFVLADTNSDNLLSITLDGNLVLFDASGTHYAQPVSANSAATTYHVWASYVKGTGANAVLTMAFSTDGVRPTSGNNFCTVTNGDSTLDAVAAVIYGGLSAGTHVFDRVIVQATAGSIGNNP